MTTAATKFLELFRSSDAIEVDGMFNRYYDDTVQAESGEPDTVAIELNFEALETTEDLTITVGDLEAATLSEEGTTWHIAGHDICFYRVETIATNPVF